MANRVLCMLADTYNEAIHRTAGMYKSEKLDGMRCLWLPATRGMAFTAVPFANRDKDNREYVCTGLWSRLGKPIMCPDWFTVGWPDHPLDGELWGGRGKFQTTMSTVRKIEPISSEWEGIQYKVFDSPQYGAVFRDGTINEPNYKKRIKCDEILAALKVTETPRTGYMNTFDIVYRLLERDLKPTRTLSLHEHKQLSFSTEQAVQQLAVALDEVTTAGGEGLMLRHPGSEWDAIRSKFLLKVKKLNDAEARVVGYRAGLGKHHGRLGSLTVRWEHVTFELGGFTDEERVFTDDAAAFAMDHPGELLPEPDRPDEHSSRFPVGMVVTFRYRELTNDKAPKEARYWRVSSLSES